MRNHPQDWGRVCKTRTSYSASDRMEAVREWMVRHPGWMSKRAVCRGVSAEGTIAYHTAFNALRALIEAGLVEVRVEDNERGGKIHNVRLKSDPGKNR